MAKKKEWWLVFDDAEFSKNAEQENYGFLNVQVYYDNCGGNQAETIIEFDTVGFGGNKIQIAVEDAHQYFDKNQNPIVEAGKVKLTIHGSCEADSFFNALGNLLKCYDMRSKLA